MTKLSLNYHQITSNTHLISSADKYADQSRMRGPAPLLLKYKNSGELLSKLKDIGYQATSLSTYVFFYLVHNITP